MINLEEYFNFLHYWWKKTESVIRCPFCLRRQINFILNMDRSENGALFKLTCENIDCKQQIFVEELVKRYYILGKTQKELTVNLKDFIIKNG